eukprot:TRINITY_DN28990_c0_g1_i1.p1 TRINITY_DN28990_c0_g1~~TRINITY_DN28990_c0_g1_i1.p1  ORF type:complete len:634 (+),score=127.83 TRINITY_DN28990_c0_g1_i1:180-2081(+)
MPSTEVWVRCLDQLQTACRTLQTEHDALKTENSTLRAQLEAKAATQQTTCAGLTAFTQPLAFSDRERPKEWVAPEEEPVIVPLPNALKEQVPEASIEFDSVTPCKPSAPMSPPSAVGERSPEQKMSKCVADLMQLGPSRLNQMRQGDWVQDMDTSDQLSKILRGLTEFDHDLFEDDDAIEARTPLQRLVRSKLFRLVFILAIVANAIYIGIATDLKVKETYKELNGADIERMGNAGDYVFLGWFSFELFIRAVAEGREFFVGEERLFNFLDFAAVLNSAFELAFQLSANLTYLRVFRVFRLVRFVRVVRNVKVLRSLRTMVFAILHTFVDLIWSLTIIFFLIFAFSVIFTSAAESHFQLVDVSEPSQLLAAEQIKEHFGGVYVSMVTLLASITGGEDWMTYGRTLRLLINDGELYFQLFCFYICVCLVGMLNVVTGIFVDNAVSTRTQDEVVDNYQEEQKRLAEEVRRIFRTADRDASGQLSRGELEKQMRDPWVRAYFAGLDIDPGEAKIIFTLLDTDRSGCLSLDEFITGVIKTKGTAKNIDLLSLMYDSSVLQSQLNKLCIFVEDQLQAVHQALDAAYVPEKRIFTKRNVGPRTLTSMRTMTSIATASMDTLPTPGILRGCLGGLQGVSE